MSKISDIISRGGRIYFHPETGYFSVSQPGWFGPDDLTPLGIYALVGETGDYYSFVNELLTRVVISESYRRLVKMKPTFTDIYWAYLGNSGYFHLTGGHGEDAPWNYLLVGQDGEGKYYVTWDSKSMEKAIDRILRKLAKGKSVERLAADSTKRDEFMDVFHDEIQLYVKFKEEEL